MDWISSSAEPYVLPNYDQELARIDVNRILSAIKMTNREHFAIRLYLRGFSNHDIARHVRSHESQVPLVLARVVEKGRIYLGLQANA